MIFVIFQEVVQNHEKSQNFELWWASRWSVFMGFQKKFGFLSIKQSLTHRTNIAMIIIFCFFMNIKILFTAIRVVVIAIFMQT